MAFVGTSRERFFFHNTLLCLVKALENTCTTIDLRNDTYVCGKIVTVDGYMNITLDDVVYCDPQGNEYKFETIYIHSRNIRYVHVPESMPILPTIKKQLSKVKYKKHSDNKGTEQSRKKQKALSQHMKTVASL